jgi:hypothetical protein
MPTPTYVSATNFLKGVAAAETAINISSFSQSWADEKLFIEDKSGSETGFVHNFKNSTSCSISGEINTATLDIVLGVAFGVAETIANSTSGYGVTAGGHYLDDIEISQDRGSLATASANFTKHPGIA